MIFRRRDAVTAASAGAALVLLFSADSVLGSPVRESTAAWKLGYGIAAKEMTQSPPPVPGERLVLSSYAISGSTSLRERCGLLYGFEHDRSAGSSSPVWPVPPEISSSVTASREYRAGWIDRCVHDRAQRH
ncbi:hypothetical protein [Actinomadura macrotermitis]|uniref:hypothetical protein n=1 Tax=Actinomadura macrotermitis TaxID=2585200 RepID=UPI001F2A4336|nr:hypothetical protein [Actinomadura macrotermitis]